MYGTLLTLTALVAVAGCGYGPISDTGYEYAKALYAVSNRQAVDRLDAVEEQIEAAASAGQLPQNEARWLHNICKKCRQGEWKSAQADARRMMQDQVKPSGN